MTLADNPRQGIIQVYTGDGKGKTTAALGLAIRASGQGLRVLFVQFVKGRISGEHRFLEQCRAFKLVKLNQGDSFSQSRQELTAVARESLAFAEKELLSGRYDLIVLDEVLVAVHMGLVSEEAVLTLIDKKPPATELVLTGRDAPEGVLQRADLVTEMKAIKHPHQKGLPARPGIEY
ncbi:MAG: cob(I)yrinic acid a,c-diamide adenosyltransferase [Chloroflexi bacterium]|nr:cob(I)yrinic acid a,c-diamide adenosyltransferase [Chloroflexota bacterium]